MTTYLLDVNIITVLEDQDKPGFDLVSRRLSALADEDEVAVSVLSAYEYKHGIAKAPAELKEALRKTWEDVEANFSILPLSLEAAEVYGKLKTLYELETQTGERRLKEHSVDFILASTALEHNAVLVSNDNVFLRIREYAPRLRVENWTER